MEEEFHRQDSLLNLESAAMPRPRQPRPIVVIGAGGIVRSAHLAAYEKAGFPVIGIMDGIREKAADLASERGIKNVFANIDEAVRFAPADAVFDIAVPASQFIHILPHLKNGSAALLQKPMGETLVEASQIRDMCRARDLKASVNFSLRYAPNHLGVRMMAEQGWLGEIHDIEVQVTTYTPWHLWSFLASAPRLEILYHSIHYFDLIRSWLGNPRSVAARTVKSPHASGLAATKTIALLDYGDSMRVFVATNHSHEFGPSHQQSFVQWEGTKAAARMTIGVNLDYPAGKPDELEFAKRGASSAQWQSIAVSGNWFPDGFMGPMGALQAFAEGSAGVPPTNIEDAYQTMALVEALYESSDQAAKWIPLPE